MTVNKEAHIPSPDAVKIRRILHIGGSGDASGTNTVKSPPLT